MGDRKGGQKLNIVDRKFIMTLIMTLKMTVKVTAKMTPKRQRMILKVKEMTLKKQKMTPRMTPKIKEKGHFTMQRNANMLKILENCVFADFMGFFVKIQSLSVPPNALLSFGKTLQYAMYQSNIKF